METLKPKTTSDDILTFVKSLRKTDNQVDKRANHFSSLQYLLPELLRIKNSINKRDKTFKVHCSKLISKIEKRIQSDFTL